MAINMGDKAPAFTLYNTDRAKISLSDFEGKNVLILFFPFAFSSVCTTELCSVRDNIALYNEANTQVLGISIDSFFTLKKYKTDQQLNFPLLSDFNKETAYAYDVLYETFPTYNMNGVSKRAAFVVDKEGIIKYAEVCPSPGDQPDFNLIKQILLGST